MVRWNWSFICWDTELLWSCSNWAVSWRNWTWSEWWNYVGSFCRALIMLQLSWLNRGLLLGNKMFILRRRWSNIMNRRLSYRAEMMYIWHNFRNVQRWITLTNWGHWHSPLNTMILISYRVHYLDFARYNCCYLWCWVSADSDWRRGIKNTRFCCDRVVL